MTRAMNSDRAKGAVNPPCFSPTLVSPIILSLCLSFPANLATSSAFFSLLPLLPPNLFLLTARILERLRLLDPSITFSLPAGRSRVPS